MSRVNHKEGKKVSPGGNFESPDLDTRSICARIEDLESKTARLDLTVTSLRFQLKFIVDLLRKQLP